MADTLKLTMNEKRYKGLGYVFDRVLEWYGIHSYDYTIQNGEYLRMACPIHGGDNNTAFVWRYQYHSWSCYSHNCHELYEGNSAFHFILAMEEGNVEKASEITRNIMAGCKNEISQKRMERRKDVKHIGHYDQLPISERDLASFSYTPYAYTRGIPRSLQRKYKIGIYKNLFPDKIGFPVFDRRGYIVGITLRQLHDGIGPKWIHKPDGYKSGINLYNINYATPYNGSMIITEGPMDVMKLVACGINNCVASFGCNLSREQIDLLKEVGVHRVLLAYDNDEAGDKGCCKASKILFDHGMEAVRLKVLGYNDFGEMPKCLIRKRSWKVEQF